MVSWSLVIVWDGVRSFSVSIYNQSNQQRPHRFNNYSFVNINTCNTLNVHAYDHSFNTRKYDHTLVYTVIPFALVQMIIPLITVYTFIQLTFVHTLVYSIIIAHAMIHLIFIHIHIIKIFDDPRSTQTYILNSFEYHIQNIKHFIY